MDLDEAVRAARAAWEPRWRDERAPVERFCITFRGGWAMCGDAMAAISSFDVSDVSWLHDPPRHEVRFSCTFAVLKSVQKVFADTDAADLKCVRVGRTA